MIGKKINYFSLAAVVLLFSMGVSPADAVAADSLKTVAENDNAVTAVRKAPVKQIVFEEQKIEGKIRRPQLVLIKADQRPEFAPMVMQSMGRTKSISILIDDNLIGSNVNSGPFSFEGTKVRYMAP